MPCYSYSVWVHDICPHQLSCLLVALEVGTGVAIGMGLFVCPSVCPSVHLSVSNWFFNVLNDLGYNPNQLPSTSIAVLVGHVGYPVRGAVTVAFSM